MNRCAESLSASKSYFWKQMGIKKTETLSATHGKSKELFKTKFSKKKKKKKNLLK